MIADYVPWRQKKWPGLSSILKTMFPATIIILLVGVDAKTVCMPKCYITSASTGISQTTTGFGAKCTSSLAVKRMSGNAI